MFQVSETALDFALTHIMAKGDTDILPPAFEYNAIFHQWQVLRPKLAKSDLDTWAVRPARRCLAPKRRLAFRIATQLDPLDTILVTAVISEVASAIESYRIPINDGVIHSYRYSPTSAGQIYSPEWNFDSFRQRSLELNEDCQGYVLVTDISDFFQRIYLHPLENALAVATGSLGHTRVITKMLSGWNQAVSYGIPVGPAIFRLLAELAIADIDQALLSEGISFCRYSDDYRIFVGSEREGREACAFLANALLDSHGLTLQESKTELIGTEEFADRFGQSERDIERKNLKDSFAEIRDVLHEKEMAAYLATDDDEVTGWESIPEFVFDPYTNIDYDDLDPDQKALVDSLNLWNVLKSQLALKANLDVPLTRFILRRIAELELADEEKILLSDIKSAYPVFPELILAASIQNPDDLDARKELGSELLALLDDEVVGHLEFHRAWILSVFTNPTWNHRDELIKIYERYPDQLTRSEVVRALGSSNADFWFRLHKRNVTSLPPWEKRAFLAAAQCLPADEAKHWYQSLLAQLDDLEQAIVRWARAQL